MKSLNLYKNKRGFMGIVFFFLILFTILILGFIGAVVVGIVDFTSETITPVIQDIGVVGNANVSEAADYTFGTTDKIVNSLPWLLLFSYVAMLIFSIIFIISYGYNPNPAYIGIYFIFVILLIFGSIIISNMYENLLTTGDEVIGAKLSEQSGMSYLMIHSPWILTIIAFIVGIYIFAGRQTETEGGVGI